MFPSNSYFEILKPKVILRDGAFGQRLGHGGGALMNGISALVKEAPESSSASLLSEDTARSLGLHQKLAVVAP